MKNEKIKYTGIGFLLGVLAMWIANITFVDSKGISMMGSNRNLESRKMMNGETIDAHFIEQMIPHHEDAITMAEIALKKSQREEVRTLAQNIITSQSQEIDQMKEWYKEWFGKDLPTGEEVMKQHGMMKGGGMHMGAMGTEEDLTLLENAEDFDREFVMNMIPHHQMAVMMASMLRNGTERDEMKKMADDIITAQSKEIDQMRQWLESW